MWETGPAVDNWPPLPRQRGWHADPTSAPGAPTRVDPAMESLNRPGSKAPRPPAPAAVLGRAALRRCPACGSGGVFRSFLHHRDRCPRCRILLDRGEGDFFIGAYTLNLIFAEVLVVAVGVAGVLVTWPAVPWDGLMWGLAGGMLAGPVILYPWSRQFWLACDLIFRPAEADDYRDCPR